MYEEFEYEWGKWGKDREEKGKKEDKGFVVEIVVRGNDKGLEGSCVLWSDFVY